MNTAHLQFSALRAAPLVTVLFASACAIPDGGQPGTTITEDEIRVSAHARVCDNPADEVQCHARVLVDSLGIVRTATTPAGLSPATLRSFYGITSTGSTSTTVAIVAANGYPRALTDLQTYRSTFGLPSIVACTSGGAHPCLAVVNESGAASPLPAFNLGWAQEMALDLDMASAMCPSCNILLVESSAATFASLAAAVNTAAASTATGSRPVAISNSYSGGEAGTTSFTASYTHPGITVTASSGDAGFAVGPQFPAASLGVLAVGGTTVHLGSTPRETVWSGAGSGCSTLYSKPSWQPNIGCSNRMIADVSAVADPNTGVAVFAPTSDTAAAFQVLGGTSAAAPVIAGIVGTTGAGIDPQTVYARVAANKSLVFDVTSGSTGSCATAAFCMGKVGFDGPTGLGTPVGPGAF